MRAREGSQEYSRFMTRDPAALAIMAFGALVAVAGIALMLYAKGEGANRVRAFGFEFELSTPALVVFLAGCALVVAPLFIVPDERGPTSVGGQGGTLGPSPVDGAVEVEITVPKEQLPRARVQRETIVRGTSKGLRDGKWIWVFTRGPGEYKYHPQRAPAEVDLNGNWKSPTVVGNENDANKEFRIIAAVVDARGMDEIARHLDQENQSGARTGLDHIPDSGHRQHIVLVERI